MVHSMRRWGGVAGLVMFSSCLSQRPPINRVQPDYMDKMDLIPNQYLALSTAGAALEVVTPQLLAKEPVFYTQTTLIAKPTTTGFTGLTSYSAADKIRWQVTETSLVARQAYSFAKNAPGGAVGIGQDVQSGDVVGIFAITSHFDIRRDYNPTTGEELNVIVENTTDRPWYQRRYLHVDWSQNLVTGYNSVFAEAAVTGTLNAEPQPIFVNSPNDPNAPVFAYSNTPDGGQQLDYFDIVNQTLLHPETTVLTADGTTYSQLPLCQLNENEGAVDCAPALVTLRVAFRRVDDRRDYEPASLSLPLNGLDGGTQTVGAYLDMSRFGFFDTNRIGYDSAQHAVLDSERLHVASRHNLWVHHHALVTAADTTTGCNSDADCGASSDSSLVCHIGNTAHDPQHRGLCAPLALAHLPGDLACASDDDCRQSSDTSGVSHTASCDTKTHTCGEYYLRCQADSDCTSAVDPQSSCDLTIAYTRADNRGLCLMPFRQRQVRPIAYHESNNYPDYMQPVTEEIVSEWNGAFVEAVSSARRHECQIEKQIDPATAAANDPCNDPQVTGLASALGADAQYPFVGCHSPVWGVADGGGQHSQAEVDGAHQRGWDLPACGPQGTAARLGDLRYNMIGAITDQDQQGYWGLANVAADPETGEMIAGRGAVWQTITDYYATQVVTYVKLLNGAIDPASVAAGSDLVSGMEALGTGKATSASMLDAPLLNQGLNNIAGISAGIRAQQLPGAGWFDPALNSLQGGDAAHPNATTIGLQRLLAGRNLGDGTDNGNARLLSLAGTPIEALMMNQQQAALAPTANPDPTAQLPQTVQAASPFGQQSDAMRHTIDRLQAKVSAFQCGMEAAFQDDILLGLAQRLSKGAPISHLDPLDASVSFGRDWNFHKIDGTIDYDLMTTYAAQFIHHGVLAHEIGHSLGQRHNFTASADAINYHDQYWVARVAKGHPKGLRPRYEYLADPNDGQYYSPQEIAARIDEWSYSSVMDYKGLNEDAHGLGRYDRAFIKNGYVNLVEAFKTVANPGKALLYSANTAGNGYSTPLDFSDYPAVHGLHYTQIPAIFGTKSDGTPNLGDDNRYDVFLKETVSSPVFGFGPPPFTNTTTDGHLLVPYRFDSDDRAGLVWQDQRYDNGADAYESLHYVSSHLVDYYFMNSFARLRSGFSTKKYKARMWGRYLDQLRQTTQIAAFDLINYQDYFGTATGWEAYLNDPAQLGGYVNQQAMSLTADTMVGILEMPAVGGHSSQTLPDGTSYVTLDPNNNPGDPFNIPVNDGRYFESAWRTSDTGFWWFDSLDHAGSYYDKTMMLQAMTDPQLLLLQRDTPSDIRLFQLNFYTMFPNQMIRLFGSLMAQDYADFAPTITPSANHGTIARSHLASINGVGSPPLVGQALPLDPQDQFTVQLWAAVQTMSQFPATYDQRYLDYARVWADGSVEQITVDPKRTVSFTDPTSGIVYRALSFACDAGKPAAAVGCSSAPHASYVAAAGGSPSYAQWTNWVPGQPGEAGIGARMLLRLNDLDVQRQVAVDAADSPKVAAALAAEGQYLDLVNVMRSLSRQFGNGNSSLP